jgi:hypothetical protein
LLVAQQLRVGASELQGTWDVLPGLFDFAASKSGHFGREHTVVGTVTHKRDFRHN